MWTLYSERSYKLRMKQVGVPNLTTCSLGHILLVIQHLESSRPTISTTGQLCSLTNRNSPKFHDPDPIVMSEVFFSNFCIIIVCLWVKSLFSDVKVFDEGVPLNWCILFDIFPPLFVEGTRNVSEASFASFIRWKFYPSSVGPIGKAPEIDISFIQWTQQFSFYAFIWWWKQSQLPKRRF
jgi:hypothetical protein